MVQARARRSLRCTPPEAQSAAHGADASTDHLGRRTLLLGAALVAPMHLAGVSGCASDPIVEVTGSVSAERASAYRAWAAQAVPAVEDLWGQGTVPRPVRLHLPATDVGWAVATGHDSTSQGVAASTVWRNGGPTVVLHPDTWRAATPEGNAAVVTHEVTHLAMGRDPHQHWWVVEGLAEYTAHRGTDQSLSDITGASTLRRLADQPPPSWPQRGNGTAPWQDYAPAWLACVYLAEAYGELSLLELHDRLSRGATLTAALASSFGTSSRDLHSDWAAWLQHQGAVS